LVIDVEVIVIVALSTPASMATASTRVVCILLPCVAISFPFAVSVDSSPVIKIEVEK
jgi:hypothetical protein